jgi:Zn-dependent protease with chaperone function
VQTEEAVTRCPQCAHQIRVDKRYVTWCDRCDWNVDPSPPDTRYPAWRQKLEHRLADTLYRELERGVVHRPGWDAARAAAYFLSGLLLLLPLAALLGGLGLLIFYRPLWLSIPLALIAFAMALLFRPRAHRLDPEAHVVTRDQAPRLYDVLDQIAEAIGTQRVAAVVVDTEPNIWFARVGWRFRPVIGIGLPLWIGLRPQERVAVLAHELGHGKNGDARHGWIVGSARSILSELHEAFSEQPLDEFRRDRGYDLNAGIAEADVNLYTRIVNATVGSLVRGYARLLDKADLRSSQRAEYLADRKAGEVAGSDATATALERLTLGETGYRALERALRFKRDLDPLEAVRLAVAEIPAREIERRVRASRIRETRTDSGHPPTYLRTKLLRTRPATAASVVLGLNDNARIERELAAAGEPALAELRREFPDR